MPETRIEEATGTSEINVVPNRDKIEVPATEEAVLDLALDFVKGYKRENILWRWSDTGTPQISLKAPGKQVLYGVDTSCMGVDGFIEVKIGKLRKHYPLIALYEVDEVRENIRDSLNKIQEELDNIIAASLREALCELVTPVLEVDEATALLDQLYQRSDEQPPLPFPEEMAKKIGMPLSDYLTLEEANGPSTSIARLYAIRDTLKLASWWSYPGNSQYFVGKMGELLIEVEKKESVRNAFREPVLEYEIRAKFGILQEDAGGMVAQVLFQCLSEARAEGKIATDAPEYARKMLWGADDYDDND